MRERSIVKKTKVFKLHLDSIIHFPMAFCPLKDEDETLNTFELHFETLFRVLNAMFRKPFRKSHNGQRVVNSEFPPPSPIRLGPIWLK